MNILSPSLLSVDFNNIERDARTICDAGVKWFHLDVMDGVFVKNISFGPPVIKSIRRITDAFFDVHLMIVDPVRYVEAFKSAGADMLTVHYEACGDKVAETISAIKSHGMKAGLAINPDTDVSVLKDYLEMVDMVLVMSVYPGFGGQRFIPDTLDKLKQVKELAAAVNPDMYIQVDGGITLENVRSVVEAGANVIVAGSAVFNGDKAQNIKEFFKILDM